MVDDKTKETKSAALSDPGFIETHSDVVKSDSGFHPIELEPETEIVSVSFDGVTYPIADLSCPDGYPPDAWEAKSERAKLAYLTGMQKSKERTGA